MIRQNGDDVELNGKIKKKETDNQNHRQWSNPIEFLLTCIGI